MVQDAFHLELVLMVGVPLSQVPELLGEVEAMRDVLGRDVVLSHFDAVVKIAYLKRMLVCIDDLNKGLPNTRFN